MRTPDTRIRGLDIARGIAVLGMFTAHTISVSTPEGGFVALDELAGGTRPRMLFALVGGMSLALLVASARRSGHEPRGEARLRIAIRGIALLALGLLLQTFFSGVSIVIDEWGLLYLLMIPLLFVPGRWLLGLAVVLMVAGHVAIAAGVGQPSTWSISGSESVRLLTAQAFSWLFTGSYPLVTWLPAIIGGCLLARADLTRAATQAWMAGVGAVVFVGGLVLSGAIDPENELSTWPATLSQQLSALGSAALVVAAFVWLTSTRVAGVGRLAGRILYPLAAAGAMPLTVYTVHVLVLAAWFVLDPAGWAPDATTWTIFTIVTLIVAPLWRLTLGQGPLERALAVASTRRSR